MASSLRSPFSNNRAKAICSNSSQSAGHSYVGGQEGQSGEAALSGRRSNWLQNQRKVGGAGRQHI